jgi:hypothetical protein
MIARVLPGIAAALTLLSTPASGQQWRQVPGAPNVTLSIDMASIRNEGPWRVFRTRTTSLGVPGTIFGVMAMHCRQGITELRSQRIVYQGKTVRERVHPVGKRPRQRVANPRNDPAFRAVCTVKR